MEDRTTEALREYEQAERELKAHWLWSLCHIAPGDFDELVRRVADRCQGLGLDPQKLKQQARETLATKTKRRSYANNVRISGTALRC